MKPEDLRPNRPRSEDAQAAGGDKLPAQIIPSVRPQFRASRSSSSTNRGPNKEPRSKRRVEGGRRHPLVPSPSKPHRVRAPSRPGEQIQFHGKSARRGLGFEYDEVPGAHNVSGPQREISRRKALGKHRVLSPHFERDPKGQAEARLYVEGRMGSMARPPRRTLARNPSSRLQVSGRAGPFRSLPSHRRGDGPNRPSWTPSVRGRPTPPSDRQAARPG